MEKAHVITNALIVAVTIIAIAVMAFIKAEAITKQMAVDNCMKGSSFKTEFTGDDKKTYTITEPSKNWYDICMKDKGY